MILKCITQSRLSLLIVFYVSMPLFCLQAQELTWVTAEGTVTMDDSITREQARTLALQAAERAAVQKAVSENVSSETLLVNLKLSGNIIGAIPFGKITKKEITHEGFVNNRKKNRKDPAPAYKVKIKAGVSEETEGFDPEFRLNASLNKTRFKHNEEMQLRIQPTKACYISIFNILEDEKILRLIPNRHKPYNYLKENEIFYFPDNIDRSRGLALMAQVPEKKNIVSESFLILGMKRPLKLDLKNIREAVFGTHIEKTALMQDLIKNISGIPMDQRGEELINYEIRK